MNYIEKAMGCCGMTVEAFAGLLGVSLPTARARINDPGNMTIKEFTRLYLEMDEYGRAILDDYCDALRSWA